MAAKTAGVGWEGYPSEGEIRKEGRKGERKRSKGKRQSVLFEL